MKVTLVAAVAVNRVIGNRDELPWHIPEDMRFFRTATMGKAIIMGRKTFDSIGKALDGRKNIVLTRDVDWKHPGVTVVHTVQDALAEATTWIPADPYNPYGAAHEAVVIGGAEIYTLFMPHATNLTLTEVHLNPVGDAFFPKLRLGEWDRVETARVFGTPTTPSYRRSVSRRRKLTPIAVKTLESPTGRIMFPPPKHTDATSYRNI